MSVFKKILLPQLNQSSFPWGLEYADCTPLQRSKAFQKGWGWV